MRTFLLLCLFLFVTSLKINAQNAAFTPVNLSSTEALPGIPICPTDMVVVGNTWFALIPEPNTQDDGRLYKSDDNGASWIKQPMALPTSNPDDYQRLLHLETIGNNLLVFALNIFTDANSKTYTNLTGYLSTDVGNTFDTVFYQEYLVLNQNYDLVNVGGLDKANGKLFFYYTLDDVTQPQVYFSDDQGANWQLADGVPLFSPITKITGDQGVYTAIAGDVVYLADNPWFFGAENNAWANGSGASILDCTIIGNTLYFCNSAGLVVQENSNGIIGAQGIQLPFPLSAAMAANGFWYFNYGGHFYRAPLNDPTNLSDAGFIPMRTYSGWNIYHHNGRFSAEGGKLFWLNDTPLESTDNGLSWHLPVADFPVRGGKLFAINHQYWLQYNDVLFHSPDGLSWTLFQNPTGILDGAFRAYDLVEFQGNIFLTQIDYLQNLENRVYRSADNGVSWQLVWQGSSLPYLVVDTDKNRLFMKLDPSPVNQPFQGLLYTDDLGATWTTVPGATNFTDFAAKGDTLFYFQNPKLHYSYDLGQTWQTNNQNFNFEYNTHLTIFPNQTVLFVERSNQIGYASLDGGQTFGQIFDLQNFPALPNAREYIRVDSLLIAWGFAGVYLSTNMGLNWVYIYEGDWVHGGNPIVQDGQLAIGISGDLDRYDGIPLRTPIQPLLDQLSLVTDAGGVAKGKAFYDLNGDCTAAFNDPARPNEVFAFQPGNYLCTSDATGAVNRILPAGTYQLQYGTPLYHDVNCLIPQGVTITQGNQTPFTIGFEPNQLVRDLAVTMVSTRARPGQTFHLTINIKHIGTQAVAAGTALNVNFQNPPIMFTDALPQPSQQSPGQLKFTLPAIAPYTSLTYKINFALPPDPGLMGQVFNINAGLNGAFPDPTPTNNAMNLPITVFNSFDPNDKTAYTVSPTGEMPLADKSLRYLIRFQNTGTDTAFRIVIRDTLSNLLNWTTLQTLATSHPYRLVMGDQGDASWHFEQILLPDSATNEAASHGFVLFSIQANEGIRIGDTLRNRAAIYFDYNHPVITNETSTAVVRRVIYREEVQTATECTAEIVPNPVGEQLQCRIYLPKTTEVTAYLCNASGQQIRQVTHQNTMSAGEHWLSCSMLDLPAGLYWLQLIFPQEKRMLQVVKI
jgi:hypothetical protein